jgi:SM-20-related protein
MAKTVDLDPLAQDLTLQGWHTSTTLVPQALCEGLLDELLRLKSEKSLLKAQMGQGAHRHRNDEIRGDYIHWLEPTSDVVAEKNFFVWLKNFIADINQTLLLGLNDFEVHYAFYPPQTQYEKHVDVFQSSSARKLSFVLYLNKEWAPENGGELILFEEKNPLQEAQRIAPEFGRLVVFLSNQIYHQVNFTKQERFSVTGWLKNRF